MTTNLFLVLILRVDNNLGDEDGQDIFEQLESEVQFCPVMPLLHNCKNIT